MGNGLANSWILEAWVIAYLARGTDSSVLDQSSSYILWRVSLSQIGEAYPKAPH